MTSCALLLLLELWRHTCLDINFDSLFGYKDSSSRNYAYYCLLYYLYMWPVVFKYRIQHPQLDVNVEKYPEFIFRFSIVCWKLLWCLHRLCKNGKYKMHFLSTFSRETFCSLPHTQLNNTVELVARTTPSSLRMPFKLDLVL